MIKRNGNTQSMYLCLCLRLVYVFLDIYNTGCIWYLHFNICVAKIIVTLRYVSFIPKLIFESLLTFIIEDYYLHQIFCIKVTRKLSPKKVNVYHHNLNDGWWDIYRKYVHNYVKPQLRLFSLLLPTANYHRIYIIEISK